MTKSLHCVTLEAARADHADRIARHAHHCVLLATVAPLSIAGELIDKAIELRATERARQRDHV
jgi:hypothetical protein